MKLTINDKDYEIENILQVKDGTFNIQFINTDKHQINVIRRQALTEFKVYGIKRVTATEGHKTKFKHYYKKLKVEFNIDGRRYITLHNTEFNPQVFCSTYDKLFKIWLQCITVLKMLESNNINNVKTFIIDMKFDYLINANIDDIIGLSVRMKSKIKYIRHLYNKS